MDYEVITEERLHEITNEYETNPDVDIYGQYMLLKPDRIVAIDCGGNDYYVEDFQTIEAAEAWLVGGADVSDAWEIDTEILSKRTKKDITNFINHLQNVANQSRNEAVEHKEPSKPIITITLKGQSIDIPLTADTFDNLLTLLIEEADEES